MRGKNAQKTRKKFSDCEPPRFVGGPVLNPAWARGPCTTHAHTHARTHARTHTHTRTHKHPFNGPLSRTTRVSYTRKIKPIWILLEKETVSGSGISWAICKSASRSRQITTPAPHHSCFLQTGCPSCRQTNSVKALKATCTTHTIAITCRNLSSL